jgi:DNA-binding MarR family transcriptional regulator
MSTTLEIAGRAMTDHAQTAPVAADAIIRDVLTPRVTRTYTPAVIAVLNGHLLWGASRIYHRRFGIGVNEWRIVARLSNHPGSTAIDTSAALVMNKSIVSRSTRLLVEMGYVKVETEDRVRRMYLTRSGADLYQAIRPIAEQREQILLGGLTTDEVDTLRSLMFKLLEQVGDLHSYDAEQVGGADATNETELAVIRSADRRAHHGDPIQDFARLA